VALPINENVVRLQVSMDDFVLMEVLQGQDYLGQVVAGSIFVKVDVIQHVGEVTSLHELHDHVEVLFGLEGVHSSHNELIVHLVQDVLLIHHVLSHVLLDHLLFLKDLHCK